MEQQNIIILASNALAKYQDYYNVIGGSETLIGVPLEDDGGTWNGIHVIWRKAQVSNSTNNRRINGVFYPGLDNELMTGWTEWTASTQDSRALPLSKITLGLLEDIGYIINDYNLSDVYQLPPLPASEKIQCLDQTTVKFSSNGKIHIHLIMFLMVTMVLLVFTMDPIL